jgi:hypothetical protein
MGNVAHALRYLFKHNSTETVAFDLAMSLVVQQIPSVIPFALSHETDAKS